MSFTWRSTVVLLGAVLAWSPAARAAKIACVGDSITAGYGLDDPSTQTYPAQLSLLLGTAHTVGNFGASGATLLEHGDYPYVGLAQHSASAAFAPDVVVIMLGTNDSKPADWASAAGASNDSGCGCRTIAGRPGRSDAWNALVALMGLSLARQSRECAVSPASEQPSVSATQ